MKANSRQILSQSMQFTCGTNHFTISYAYSMNCYKYKVSCGVKYITKYEI